MKPHVDIDDLDGLPAELLSQLKIPVSVKVKYIMAAGAMTTDKLMVAYYKKFGEVLEKKKVWTLLSRMEKAGEVCRSTRGVYSLSASTVSREDQSNG